jgi:hypothetical protein
MVSAARRYPEKLSKNIKLSKMEVFLSKNKKRS